MASFLSLLLSLSMTITIASAYISPSSLSSTGSLVFYRNNGINSIVIARSSSSSPLTTTTTFRLSSHYHPHSHPAARTLSAIFQSSSDDDDDNVVSSSTTTDKKKRRRKRKRKQQQVEGDDGDSEKLVSLMDDAAKYDNDEDDDDDDDGSIPLRDVNAFVNIEIKDIRDVTSSGRRTTTTTTTPSSSPSPITTPSTTSTNDDNDSLKSLLADAKRLRGNDGDKSDENDEFSVGDTIRNVISTIVTVDFFIVLGLLAWFLAGIFCSYVVKDDTVQIAFNNIFEPVVQPALGVLMIASAAGAVGKKDKDE